MPLLVFLAGSTGSSTDYSFANLALMAIYVGLTLILAIVAIASIIINSRQSRDALAVSDRQSKEAIDAIDRQIKASEHQLKLQIDASEAQINKQIEENRRLVIDERQHQNRPIIVPEGVIYHNTVTTYNMATKMVNESLYTSEDKINWGWQHPVRIKLRNMGSGPAFNLHCLLYGPEDMCYSQFVSWDNGPIEEKSSTEIELIHSPELLLYPGDSVDGKHPLYDKSLNSSLNPWIYRTACLTITYHDLFDKKHMSIFHYTLQHRWIHVSTGEITEKPPLDLKELNDRKHQGTQLSAPPLITR